MQKSPTAIRKMMRLKSRSGKHLLYWKKKLFGEIYCLSMKSLSAAGKFKKKRYQEETLKKKVKKVGEISEIVSVSIINKRLHWRNFSPGLKTLRPWTELWSLRDKISPKRMLFQRKYFIWLKEWVMRNPLMILFFLSFVDTKGVRQTEEGWRYGGRGRSDDLYFGSF